MAAKKKQNQSKQNSVKSSCQIEKSVNCTKKKKNCKRKQQQQQQQKQFLNEDDYRLRLQEVLYSRDYILAKIFRKDGPPLGEEFNSLPENAFCLRQKKGNLSRKIHFTFCVNFYEAFDC